MKDYHVEEDADGDEIEYSATCKLNAYSQGWKYFYLLIPAKEWKSTYFTFSFNDNIVTLYIDREAEIPTALPRPQGI